MIDELQSFDPGDDSLSTTESDLTAAANAFLSTRVIRNLALCLTDENTFEARFRAGMPVGGDRNVRATGTIDLTGRHPVVAIREVNLGSLGFLTDLGIDQLVEDRINDELADIDLRHDYVVSRDADDVRIEVARRQ